MYALKKYHSSGSRSTFYTVENRPTVGFKTFGTKQEAEYARDIQMELSDYNLAPNVYSEVGRIRIGKKRKQFSEWGYITEKAELIGCGGNSCECGECCDHEDDMRDEINDLVDKIEGIGYYFGDSHVGNVGFVKRNGVDVLVCIDTGEESVQPWDDNDRMLSDDDGGCNCTHCRNFRRNKNYA